MWRWAEDLLVTKLKFFIISGLENKFSCPLSSPHLLLLSRSSWSFVGSDITRCVTPQTPFSFFFPISSSVSSTFQLFFFFSFVTHCVPTNIYIFSCAPFSYRLFVFSLLSVSLPNFLSLIFYFFILSLSRINTVSPCSSFSLSYFLSPLSLVMALITFPFPPDLPLLVFSHHDDSAPLIGSHQSQ